MLNPWNDLIKQETNQGLIAQNNPNNNMMYEADPNNMMLMNGGGVNAGNNNNMVNGMPTNTVPSQAQVAAAVATAMMIQNPNCNSLGMSGMDDCMDDDDCGDDDDDGDSSMNNDAEGVWSPDIEQSFQEALAIYPPCGRRKIILSEEGKMYGRNELIARYIKVRTGKSRSRKQVSSHIQVLAKRKTKDFHSTFKDEKSGKCAQAAPVGFSNPFSHLTSAQIISPTPIPGGQQQQSTTNNVPQQQNHINNIQNQNQQNPNQIQHMQMNQNNMNQNLQNQHVLQNQQPQRPLTNSHNTHNHHNQQQPHHQPQMLQNCTNILPNVNMNLQQSQSCNIWSHPGLQPEKKARIDMSQNIPASTMPCSASSPNQLNSQGDELIPSSSSSSASSSSSIANHNMLGQTSPESSSPPNQNIWPGSYAKNNEFNSFNKCIMGLNGLRLIEFSCFLEQRPDTEIYNKHLFVHLNTSDYFSYNNYKNDSNNNSNGMNTISEPSDEFENINYIEFADKFPENDLLWSLANVSNDKASTSPTSSNSAAYLIKFWVDLNYTLEENINAMYAVTNIFESPEPLSISCSTKVCSFGNQVVEKVETEHAQYDSNGRCGYRFENSPMCEYMITFINKLKKLPERNLKNSVLENFSVLQLIKNNDTQELLLTLAYVFEVSTSDHGAQHNIYKLTNK